MQRFFQGMVLLAALLASLHHGPALAQGAYGTGPKPLLEFGIEPVPIRSGTGWGYWFKLFPDRTIIFTGNGQTSATGTKVFRVTTDQLDRLIALYEEEKISSRPGGAGFAMETMMHIIYTHDGLSTAIYGGEPNTGWTGPIIRVVRETPEILGLKGLICPVEMELGQGRRMEGCAWFDRQLDAQQQHWEAYERERRK